MKKKCFKCGNIKGVENFYKHNQTADGYLGKCKTCTKEDTSRRYRDPEARQRIIEYERKRELDPARKLKKLEYQRKRRANSPGKSRCRQAVSSALRYGRITRSNCQVCGAVKVEAHHPDYRSPLRIVWLCRKHHLEIDGKVPF